MLSKEKTEQEPGLDEPEPVAETPVHTYDPDSPHWSGVTKIGMDGTPLSEAGRELFRAIVNLADWPEAQELGKAAHLDERQLYDLANAYRATQPDTWRESYLDALKTRAVGIRNGDPGAGMTEVERVGKGIGKTPAFITARRMQELQTLLGEVQSAYQGAALDELIEHLKKWQVANPATIRVRVRPF